MFDKIKFDGYRLLDGFEADLGQLTVMIGANATGKSTLLDALMLIVHSLDWSIEDMLAQRWGLSSILSASRDCREMSWEFVIRTPHSHPFWSKGPTDPTMPLVYEGCVELGSTMQVRVSRECLRNADPHKGYARPLKWFDVRGDRASIYNRREKKLLPFNEPSGSSESDEVNPLAGLSGGLDVPVPKESLFLSQMRFANEYAVPTWVRALLASSSFYPGFDVGRDSPIRTKPSELRPYTTLSMDGSNLGTVLHEIVTVYDHRESKKELFDFLSSAYPEITDVTAETTKGGEPRLLVRVKESGLNRTTEMWELSDGMLRFLLLGAALLNPVPPPFVAIDEPEAGLHPRLLPVLADMIRSASQRSQVLIATHSPALLDCFDLADIAVLTRDEGRARWNRPGHRESLRKMLEAEVGGTLGELHASGELEATS